MPISGTELRRRCRTRRRDRHRLLSLHPVTTGSPELRRARPWGGARGGVSAEPSTDDGGGAGDRNRENNAITTD